MRWLMEFYHQRQEILARYDVEAPLRAVLLGRSALLVEYPSTPTKGPLSLFKQAQRIEGQDPRGWTVYRIGEGDDDGSEQGSIINRLDQEAQHDGSGNDPREGSRPHDEAAPAP
jgi:hypothetical protein